MLTDIQLALLGDRAAQERMRLWGLANKCMDRVLGALEESYEKIDH
jgi:hypothetical protein